MNELIGPQLGEDGLQAAHSPTSFGRWPEVPTHDSGADLRVVRAYHSDDYPSALTAGNVRSLRRMAVSPDQLLVVAPRRKDNTSCPADIRYRAWRLCLNLGYARRACRRRGLAVPGRYLRATRRPGSCGRESRRVHLRTYFVAEGQGGSRTRSTLGQIPHRDRPFRCRRGR